MLEGFQEKVAHAPAASTVHSGGHFFPLSRGPTLSPRPLSSGWTRYAFSFWSQNHACCWSQAVRVYGVADCLIAYLQAFLWLPNAQIPSQPARPPPAQAAEELGETPQQVAPGHRRVPGPKDAGPASMHSLNRAQATPA